MGGGPAAVVGAEPAHQLVHDQSGRDDATDDERGARAGGAVQGRRQKRAHGLAGTGSSDPPQAAPDVDTSGPSSVPIPLLVLGGMSIALLAAGGLGYLSRRRNAAHADDPGDLDTLA